MKISAPFCLQDTFLFILFSILSFSIVQAQVDFTGSTTIDFTGFAGTGLVSSPSSGELDSDEWLVSGMSDGSSTYGGSSTSGDFARGNTVGGVTTGGLYTLNTGAIWIAPGGSDMTPGEITLRVTNNTGSDLNTLDLSYDIPFLNDVERAVSVNFAYSTDDVTYMPVAALDFVTPLASDGLGVQMEAKSTQLVFGTAISDGANFFLRWEIDDAGGSGSRDEVGLDNISFSVPLPVKNEDTGESFMTIQEAIDDANTLDGHVITVAPGTYTEAISITKAITLNGASQGISGTDPRIDISALLNSTINVSAAGTVIIDGFDILRNDAVAGDMILLGGNSTVTVRNNVISRMGSAPGIGARGLVTAAGAGVKTITDNLFTGDPSGGLFSGHVSWNNALYINGNASNVNITNNKIENSRTGINVDDFNAGININGNSIDNNGTQLALGGVTPTMGDNTLGANDFINNPASTMINLSNVNENFSLDISSGTLDGVSFAALSLPQLFEVEARMAHKEVSPGKRGKVVYVAGKSYVNNFIAPFTKIDIINNSVKYADTNEEIILQSGTYNQRVTIDKSDLTVKGETMDKTMTVLDGTGLGNGSGIFITNNTTNITIQDLTVQNFSGSSGNTHAGIYANLGNNDLSILNVAILNNVGGSGFYANGPVDGVLIDNCMVSGHTVGARGIVIWNGLKENIIFTNNMVTNNSCCGIELQDGDADGVLIEGNTVTVTTGDSGMGLTGMSNATVNNNTVSGVGRFGIEIKNPNGNVSVTNNMVTNTGASDSRDYAGIAVFRRAITPASNNPDIPQGVTVTGNTVTGYQNPGAVAEGFGIVVEGIDHTVSGNTLESNDIGIQLQGGGHANANYPAGDGDQTAGQSPNYFGRGNAPVICNVSLGANTFVGATNGINTRLVDSEQIETNLATITDIITAKVENITQGTFHCSIKEAIEFAMADDVLEILVDDYTEPEQIVVDKNLTLQGLGKTNTTLRPGFDTGSSGDTRGFILVEGVEFNLKDLTIDGTGQLVHQAIRHKGEGSVENVRFTQIKFNESGPTYAGTAIAAFGTGPVDVTNSMFDEIGRIGVLYFGANLATSEFSGNMYTGKGEGDWLDYMLDISAGAIVNVTNNEVSNNRGVASSDGSTSAGILVSTFFGPGTEANITGNEIENNTTGIFVGFDGSDASTVVARDNNIFDNDNGAFSTAVNIDAVENYWGAANGPSGLGSGSGNGVNAEIDACPYYNAPVGSGSEMLVGPIENTTSGMFFCTIQEAIDDAGTMSGHTIVVPDGTWSENITVTKGVILSGPNAGIAGCITRVTEAIIEPATAGTTPITIGADGVTINGFTITNPDGNFAILNTADSDMTIINNIITEVGTNAGSGNTHSIYVSANSGAVNNITIGDNRFFDIRGGESDPVVSNGSASAVLIGDSNAANDLTNLSIANNCIEKVRAAIVPFLSGNQGGKGAYGILLGIGGNGGGAAIDAQITGNDIRDLEGLWAHAIGLEGNTPSADVLNNTIDDVRDHKTPSDAVAVLLEDNSDVSDIKINDNSFTNVNIGVWNKEASTVDATCNYWDAMDAAIIADKIVGPVLASPFLTDATDDSADIGFQPLAGACDGAFPILNVNSNDFFATIQAGVEAATTGDTLEIQTAEHTEPSQIIIDKNLTLRGMGKTLTTLKPGFDTGASGDARGFILVNAGVDFVIKDLTIDGTGKLVYQAIRQRGSGSVENVRFTEIKYNESGPTYAGTAMAAFGTGPVDVYNSMFDEIGRIGVLYFGAGVATSTFDGNMYTGKGEGDWLDYMLDISAGAIVNVTNNQVSNNKGVASSDGSTSAGIVVTTFFGPGTEATITGNEINDNTTGIAVGFDNADASVVTASDNNIFNNTNGITSTGPSVDAQENYWGAANGPGGSGTGSGDNVDSQVDACPYYDAPIGSGAEMLVGPIQNTTTGEFFCTIQEAIDDAETLAGHTISVPVGAWAENISVNKGVTLAGPNANTSGCEPRAMEAIIEPATAGTTPITIAANGVTISGFLILNPDGNFAILNTADNDMTVTNNIITRVGVNASSGNTHSIYVSANNGPVDNINIEGNRFIDIRGGTADPVISNGSASAILIGDSNAANDVTNLSIVNNCIERIRAAIVPFQSGNQGGKGAYGILLGIGGNGGGAAVDAQIIGNEIRDIEGLWAHAIGLEGNTPSADVLNNKIDDVRDHKTPTDAVAILLEDNVDVSEIKINDNSFTNVNVGVWNKEPGTVDAACNFWDTTDPAMIAAKTVGPVSTSPYLTDGTDDNADLGFQPLAGACDGTFPILNLNSGISYISVQAGVDAATAGDTLEIQVVEHTEPGQIVIDRDLTLQGKGKSMTTLKSNYNTASSGHGNDLSAWIRTEPGTNVTIQDLTIDATGQDTYTAVRFKDSGLMDNVAINEVKHSSSPYLGIAVQVQDGTVDIDSCMFTNIGRIGVHYRNGVLPGAVIAGTYSNNMYTGKGDGDWLDYALDISGGTTIAIIDNMISNNTGVASTDGSTSAGILVTSFFPTPANSVPNNVTITGNDLFENTTGIAVGFNGDDISVVTVSDNNIFDNENGIVSTGPIVDAEENYWGSPDGPTGVGSGSGNGISAGVNACPFYDAPVPTGTLVDCRVQNITTGEGFFNIQDAIDDTDTQDDDVIEVAAGTYVEDIVVNKRLTISGPFATTSGCDMSRGAGEAVLHALTDGGTIVSITASGSTLAGFTLDGTDAMNATQALVGVNSIADATIHNNIITNLTNADASSMDVPYGVFASGAISMEIATNCISNVASQSLAGVATGTGVPGIGVMILGDANADVETNEVTASDVGIRISTNMAGIVTIEDNLVSSGIPSPLTAGISIDEISAAGQVVFVGTNTVSNNAFGVFVAGTNGTDELVINNIEVTGNGVGVYGTNALVTGPSSTTTFTVENIMITNSLANGIYLVESAFSASDINVTVDSTEISGTQAADNNSSAIAVFDGDAGATGEVNLAVSNTNMHDNINRGMVVAGNVSVRNSIFNNNGSAASSPGQGLNVILRPTAQTVSFVENSFTGVAGMNANVRVENGVEATFFNNSFVQGGAAHQFDFFAIGADAPEVNASGNWWGSTDDDVILASHDGNAGNAYLDYSPYLNEGTDTDMNGATTSDLGFQGDFQNDLHVDAESAQFAMGATGNIQEGIDLIQSGNTLFVNGGMYDEQAIANKAVTLQGDDDPMWDFTGAVIGKTTLLDVSADMVTIDAIMFKPDLTNLHSAIIVSGMTIDNITITNNTINPYQSTPGVHLGGYGSRNAISINYAGFRVASGGVDNILVTGNTVTVGKIGPDFFDDDAMFRSAISVDEGAGTYTNNDFASINHDILNRFNNNGDILVSNNTFRGGGVELAEYNAGGGTVTVDNNLFDSEFAVGYTNRLRLKNNQQDKETTISNNIFTNHSWGISLENYSDVTIDNNTFTPADIADYRHITINTKLNNSNSNSIVQDEINGTFTNNAFNPAATAGGGLAMAFYNHDSDNADIGEFIVGTDGNENIFNEGIAEFIRLDDMLGSTDGVFPEYSSGGGWTTTMACWAENINIKENLFDVGDGLMESNAMSSAGLLALEDLLYHQPDNACLGELVYFAAEIMLTINGEEAKNINNGTVDATEDVSIKVCDADGNITFSNVTGSTGNIGVVIDFTAATNLLTNGVDPFGITISATLADFNANFIAANQPANFRLVDPSIPGSTTATLVPFNDTNKNGIIDAGECIGETITFTIEVDPIATVDEISDQLLCPGENSMAVVFTGLLPGATYNWTNDNTAIGLGASGSGDIASFVAANATTQPITATITVTPVSTMGGFDCEGASEQFTITVLDGEAPEIVCVADITESAGMDSCSTTVLFDSPKAYDPQYFEGFDNPDFMTNTPAGWNEFQSTITRLDGPGAGPSIGSGYPYGLIDNTDPGISNTGVFSRLGGYNTTFGNGYRVRQDVYIDLSDPAVLADTYGWDLSSAVSGQDGNHQRDFIFHTASNADGNVLVGGSNNTNFTRRNDIATLNHYEITATGWYTFEFIYRDAGDGTLAVDLNLLDDSGIVLFTETRNNASDIIATEVGGNRYLWFTFIEVDYLAIDNTQRSNTLNVSCDLTSGSEFFVGETTVTCSATDDCGDVAECTFTVTVTDDQAPLFENCPMDEVACNDDDSYSWTHPSLVDNCALMGGSMTAFTYSLSGATTKGAVDVMSFDGTTMATETFNEGVTTVTYMAQDSSGNVVGNVCSFEVTVEARPTIEVLYSGPSTTVTANNNAVSNDFELSLCSDETLTVGAAMSTGGTVDPSACGELRTQTVITNNIPDVATMSTVDEAIGNTWVPNTFAFENTNSNTRSVVYVTTPYYDTNDNDMLDGGDRLGVPYTFTLFVDPVPVAIAESTEEKCNATEYTLRLDEYITNIEDIDNDDDDDNQPITYNWEITDITPLPIVIGVMENQTGTGDITHTVTNPYTIVETIEYTITPISENGCEGDPFVVNVNINPNPMVAINPNGDNSLCQGEERTILGFVLPADSYDYQWSIVSAGSGNASLVNETTLSPILTAQTDNENDVTVRFVATNIMTGCVDSTDVTYTVASTPSFAMGEPLDLETCENVAGGLLGTFDLTTSVTGVSPMSATVTYHTSASDAENGSGALGTPENYTATDGETVFVRVENNGCYIVEDVLLTVYPIPVITINAPAVVCANADPIMLTAMPMGGTFSGSGVTGNMFDPAMAGMGVHTITYTFTSTDGCGATGTVNINVAPSETIVMNTNDAGPGSLRAVMTSPCVGDTVFFDAGLAGETISLTSGEIVVAKDVVIQGLGIDMITISGNDASRIFNIESGLDVVVNDLALINGYSLTNGGAIWNKGDLRIKDVRLEGNNEDIVPKALTIATGATLTVAGDCIINE